MIDYSVYMQHNPMDETAALKAYAKAQMRELITFKRFVEHIASHNGVYSRGTVRGVIVDMCECLVEMLLDGKKVQLDELGNFWISLSCEGAESMEKFTADNIKEVNIIFTPGSDFENLIGKAEFNVVSSRSAQIATLKAEKAGASTVDLEAARNNKKSDSSAASSDSGSSDTGGSTSSDSSYTGGDSSNTGGSSDSGASGDSGSSDSGGANL